MARIKLTKARARRPKPFKGITKGFTLLHRDVTPALSDTMVCGVVVHHKRHAWTIRYDEYYYLLEGRLTIHVGRKRYAMRPGDSIWLPENTALIYDPRPTAKVVYGVYPIDWRERAARRGIALTGTKRPRRR